ncbi:amidohydrolase family protein [Aestuariivirga sp.]|uniref:amidohydrolase family protein n=1 Tax=Aestuariivirga sp. TaxID=2650926 RepID=UPI0039E2A70A
MFVTSNGEKVFVIDAHCHVWDARPSNIRNRNGQMFINTFFGAHNALTPPEDRWTAERFSYQGAERAAKDLFEDGHVDMAVMLPVYLYDFFNDGFNTTTQCGSLKDLYPERVILNGRIDPRDGGRGLDRLERDFEKWRFTGVKLYTAEWNGASRGYSMKDPFVVPYLEKCRELGIRNIHLHKGPTTYPLDYDAFDVRDVDYIATNYPDLNFIIDHCGMPRIDDFCFIAGQEPNVYGGLALIPSYIHARPKFFAKMLSDLLFWVGPDRLLFGSDYAITSPGWIIEKFMDFQFDDDTAQEAGTQLTLDVKRKILGLNAAKLYGVSVPSEFALPKAA